MARQELSHTKTVANLFSEIERKILSLDIGIRKEYRQKYIAYKVDTNFATIKISKNELTVGLNIPFELIHDPLDICIDKTNTGNFSNNDVHIKITVDTNINNVMELVIQALIYQM